MPPIPPTPPDTPTDIWERLSRLNASRDVNIRCVHISDALGTVMHWEISVARKDAPDEEPVVVLRRSLLEAIVSTLEAVEREGVERRAQRGRAKGQMAHSKEEGRARGAPAGPPS